MENRYRNYCVTTWIEPKIKLGKLTYMIYQPELCPESKKQHFQCYCEFDDKVSFKQVKEIFNDNTIHIEPRYGSQKQAIEYCNKSKSKNGKTIEIGIPKSQGNRSDLDSIFDDIENGHTSKEILKIHRGKGLRYINMIIRGLESMADCVAIDHVILLNRTIPNKEITEECPEVGGNTDPQLLDILEIEKKHYIKDELKRLRKK